MDAIEDAIDSQREINLAQDARLDPVINATEAQNSISQANQTE